jgi:prevent-host-death family protein
MAIKIAIVKLMQKRYSIAQARDNLASIVHSLIDSKRVEITRRGQPVAVLISVQEYERLHNGRKSFKECIKDYRDSLDDEESNIDPAEVFNRIRDQSPGRDIAL